MRRAEQKAFNAEVDGIVLQSIKDGNGHHAKLIAAIMSYFMVGGSHLSLPRLMRLFAGYVVSTSKQRLRAERLIEIGKGNVAKLSETIKNEPEEQEFILYRRQSNLHGALKSSVLFAHRHGHHDECRKFLEMFSVMFPADAKELHEQLFGVGDDDGMTVSS